MILWFLETGENRFLGEFIDKKIKESEELILKINNDKILVWKKKKLEEEKDERESEEEEVEELLNF
jgi:hypothetical protein